MIDYTYNWIKAPFPFFLIPSNISSVPPKARIAYLTSFSFIIYSKKLISIKNNLQATNLEFEIF